MKRKNGVCALQKVQLCVKVLKHVKSPNPSWHPHHFPALQVWTDITQPSIKPSPSHPLPVIVLYLFFILFVIIRWQKQCRLSDSDWLLDIESRKGRGSPLFHVRPLILVAGGPDGRVVNDGGCAAVSAPELYPFLSITVQVKQMIGFSQWGD